ncbi:capsid protein precursor [Bovine astrovirus B76/HK]|uniref:capsid protein precursor n=1 Tax=Bovine astrovirus B76/HK TaxID=1027248 RepID=UPI00020CD90B|nr:capsid protein precursor [Bovine astrovirus B76/HK]AED89609.1 capsid protein precursor [Bovine astrovirus B76/HK]
MSSWIVFGGEDQRQILMASRSQNRRAARTTTSIVVRNGPAATQGGGGQPRQQQQQRRRRRRARQTTQMVRVLPVKNQSRRRGFRPSGVGNRVVYQKIVTTLGTVGSNGSGNLETELAVLLNPSTMKEATGSNTYGPLQIYASTYSLFQMRSLKLHLKPLVGASAVSGTAVRMSWNPTNNPTQTSWSALGARKHSDTTPGKDGFFRLTNRDLRGPKDGWFKTNTKGDPMMSFAGSLEIHTLGETRSTYQNGQYTGGLFLAELETNWAFKDYAQQPGFLNLVKGDSEAGAQITTDASGKILMQVPQNTRLARAASTTTAAEIIWMVTDAIIQAGTAAFPQPFQWLFRGGWWFIKKIAGAPVRSGYDTFEVYSSITDARSGAACVADQVAQTPVSVGSLHYQQITPGNTGITTGIQRAVEAPEQPLVVTNSWRLPFNSDVERPGFDHWYHNSDGGQNPETGACVMADGRVRATFSVLRVQLFGSPDPDRFENKVPVYLRVSSSSSPLVGFAVAYHRAALTGTTNQFQVDTLLVYATNTDGANFERRWKGTRVQYPGTDGNLHIDTPVDGTQGRVRIQFRSGSWYILQFVTYGRPTAVLTAAGIEIINITTGPFTSGNHTLPVAGTEDPGIVPVYGAGMVFTPLPSGELNYRELPSPQVLDEDVYHDMPPLEDGDSDDDEDDPALEMEPGDDYDVPPLSRCVVHPSVQGTYELLLGTHPERDARLAVNQLHPSDEYKEFTTLYHDALVDGLSPKEARAFALGL